PRSRGPRPRWRSRRQRVASASRARASAARPLRRLAELLGLVDHLADVADHVKGLLGQVVVLALDDLLEALDRVSELDVPSRTARERLRDEHRLREKPLDLAGPGDDQLVLVGQLLHPEDGDDVLEVLVPLEDRLDRAGRLIVLLAKDRGVEDS